LGKDKEKKDFFRIVGDFRLGKYFWVKRIDKIPSRFAKLRQEWD